MSINSFLNSIMPCPEFLDSRFMAICWLVSNVPCCDDQTKFSHYWTQVNLYISTHKVFGAYHVLGNK